MTKEHAQTLERLLRENDLGVVLDTYTPSPDRLLEYLLELLDKVASEYHARFGVGISFAPEVLEAEWVRHPHRIRAFLQAMRMTRSAEMLVMVWQILQGLIVQEVKMIYRKRQTFELIIVLAKPGRHQNTSEIYKSTDIFDVRLLRHFAIAAVADQPSFGGFLPLRLSD